MHKQTQDQWVVKNLFPCCCRFFRFTHGYSCWRRDASVCTQFLLRHNIWGWKHSLSSTATFSHFQREIMPKQGYFPLPYTFSHLSFVNDWTEIIMVQTALKWESEVHWLHLDGQQRQLPLSAGFTPWLTPIGVKKTNKVTLNGKGLVGVARGNGAESALAKASKPFSYWQMKSESLSKICDFPQSPLIRFLSLALPPPFFSYALSEVLSTACSRQKSEIRFFPLFTNMP